MDKAEVTRLCDELQEHIIKSSEHTAAPARAFEQLASGDNCANPKVFMVGAGMMISSLHGLLGVREWIARNA